MCITGVSLKAVVLLEGCTTSTYNIIGKVKVKCTLVQALRLCTGLRPIGGVEV
jgi:hypothetical protein